MNDQIELMRNGTGFIAALDQSGGSTPKALDRYGVPESAYSNEDEMFDLVHQMRVRIMTDDSFSRPRILGAILFQGTLERDVEGKPSSRYLSEEKNILPFLKVDKGLADENDGVQLMKPFGDMTDRLAEAKSLGVFGTKMRSVIQGPSESGIQSVVDQQFEYARQILSAGLIPIVEPEVDINAEEKEICESLLREQLRAGLDSLDTGTAIVFKLTLPEIADFYLEFASHPAVLRVAALSGGYSQDESNRRLGENSNMIASFSRALTENLRNSQSDADFSSTLDEAIDGIATASAS